VDLKLQVLNTPSVANLHYLRWQLLPVDPTIWNNWKVMYHL
jgi:hypothetical protein